MPAEKCTCLCPYPLPSGPVKRETEDRRSGEDKGGHQAADPGCCCPHQEGGGEFSAGADTAPKLNNRIQADWFIP